MFCFYLQAISSLPLLCFAIKCDLKSKLQLTFTFFASVTQSNGPLRKYELSSVGTKDHVSRFWLINFDPYCLFRFVVVMINYLFSRNVLLFSCNPIGQLCLGGRGYSSRTVMPYVILNDTFCMMVYL